MLISNLGFITEGNFEYLTSIKHDLFSKVDIEKIKLAVAKKKIYLKNFMYAKIVDVDGPRHT